MVCRQNLNLCCSVSNNGERVSLLLFLGFNYNTGGSSDNCLDNTSVSVLYPHYDSLSCFTCVYLVTMDMLDLGKNSQVSV